MFFGPVRRIACPPDEEGAWAKIQGQTFVTGYTLQVRTRSSLTGFPFLSLLCAAANLSSTIIIYWNAKLLSTKVTNQMFLLFLF